MEEGTSPTCPECKKPIKARKRGACPHCDVALMLYKGYYYREEQGTPTLAILAAFERYVSQQLSKKQGKAIPYHISKKTPHIGVSWSSVNDYSKPVMAIWIWLCWC